MIGRPSNDNGDFDPYHGGEATPLPPPPQKLVLSETVP